ncbi:MAG: DNA-3-methyladenine glycosylase I [Pseudomonadota bacterium]|nr:DNA-3-methyladenine glycosylase I [Pseudomonadota bacterium]
MDQIIPAGLLLGNDHRLRCWWQGGAADYQHYHDHEWGRPVVDDRRLFEKICLEGFQSGLSWLTILRKRENFRAAFAQFDIERLQHFADADVERLLQDAGIVRHRGKIASTLNNAKQALRLRDEFGSLSRYFWQHEPTAEQRPLQMDHASLRAIAKTATSTELSKDLKRRGWSFVGPTTMYAFMQAMGLVNDHVEGCWVREPAMLERNAM